MKTELDAIAKFIGAAVWADGVYDEAEKIAVEEIAEAFSLDADSFSKAVENYVKEVEGLNEEAAIQYLIDAAVDIDDEEAEAIFEAALEVVLADGVINNDEVSNLISIADALGVETSRAILMLCDMIKEEPDMTIEF